MMRKPQIVFVPLCLTLASACSEESEAPPANTGGTTGSGGVTPSTGGSTSSGGTPGGSGGFSPAVGGTPSVGGSAGGTPAGGATSGGASAGGAGGGSSSTGGALNGTGGSSSGGSATGGSEGGGTACPYTPPAGPETSEPWVSGEVTVFNENGGWTWYNDERVVVDTEGGKILLSSAASQANNQTGNTAIDVVIYDIETGASDKTAVGSLSYSDDHNNGGIVVKAPGEYFVAWAHHNAECTTYFSNFSAGSWSNQQTYDWRQHGCSWNSNSGATSCTPGDSDPGSCVTYNNVLQMSEEGRIYNFIRAEGTNPNLLVSEDGGASWSYEGRLTRSPQQGYNAGYYKYWGNGSDRIDFFATEAHPRDANTSVFHGYIMGGKSYDSAGREVDGDIFDQDAPEITEFTRIFQAGNMLGGATMNRLWNYDIARYADGTIAVLWQAREQANAQKNSIESWDPGHHMAYSRFDGTEWKSTRLVRGGRTLYRRPSGDWWEEDYLGGGALDPDDPHVIYISTNIDPRDDTTEYAWNEIWKGVTCDDGATFQWTPVTMNSSSENVRPAVPQWDDQHTLLTWFRGVYNTAQEYDTEVVGMITQPE